MLSMDVGALISAVGLTRFAAGRIVFTRDAVLGALPKLAGSQQMFFSPARRLVSSIGWVCAGMSKKTHGICVKQIRSQSDQTAYHYCLTLFFGR